ncbi:amidohydrolase [Alicyclobacillus mali]|uniref:Amidohydrolase n=2 Tax=Alicyclobacillus mali (ex Roth et al. 2021) TaxID=1123961 RepID=A0ABS0F600_9BACL|nr:M20 family metallopeptidase [Alicyclobacillus mali (ex Roth et al. 2021)]MBF8378692.1 amidohydrolase [Alicyclobacillus mali (ex Roth et al. 2021)]MCL6487441.1 amidohydrolase [Alicyclobacillus mali (ex Roth et al. 2021)]
MELLVREVEAMRQQLVAWRRHLHEHPELSFQERETAAFIERELTQMGAFEISRPTETSVIARLVTGRPGRVLALRADIDALPIEEDTGLEFASKNPGVMHACGHDGHTAMLLGACKVLAAHRDELRGEIRFIFQHAEELTPGGAQELVDAGVLDGVDAVIGQHLWQGMESCRIGVRAGELMAAPDTFHIRIVGRGGHAAQPHLTVDPIAIGAQIVVSLQQLASRRVDPFEPFVLSVTKFVGGTADNVIPNEVELCGTVRTFREERRAWAAQAMEAVIRGIAEAQGASYEFRYDRGYRPVVNDPELTAFVRATLEDEFGDLVTDAEPTMGGEDFSAYQTVAPGTFFFTGIRRPDGEAYPHHHPRFDIDENALVVGCRALVALATRYLGQA